MLRLGIFQPNLHMYVDYTIPAASASLI
jgi:hypothetical protein